jgi:hypothetical protein
MKFTRREGIIGLGLLATGSGATFTSAAFQSSTQPSADLRVIVERDLRVRAGKAFRGGNPNGSYGTVTNKNKFKIIPNNESFFNTGGLADLNADETPAATVNDKVNDNLKFEVAFNPADSEFSSNTLRFPNILQVVNNGTQDAQVGILYDRTNSQYGGDISSTGDLTREVVQHIYRFKVDGGDIDGTSADVQISPDRDTTGGITNSYDESDYPANDVSVKSGELINIHLDINIGPYFDNNNNAIKPRDILTNKATDDNPFKRDVLDLLDAITVATNPTTANQV